MRLSGMADKREQRCRLATQALRFARASSHEWRNLPRMQRYCDDNAIQVPGSQGLEVPGLWRGIAPVPEVDRINAAPGIPAQRYCDVSFQHEGIFSARAFYGPCLVARGVFHTTGKAEVAFPCTRTFLRYPIVLNFHQRTEHAPNPVPLWQFKPPARQQRTEQSRRLLLH